MGSVQGIHSGEGRALSLWWNTLKENWTEYWQTIADNWTVNKDRLVADWEAFKLAVAEKVAALPWFLLLDEKLQVAVNRMKIWLFNLKQKWNEVKEAIKEYIFDLYSKFLFLRNRFQYIVAQMKLKLIEWKDKFLEIKDLLLEYVQNLMDKLQELWDKAEEVWPGFTSAVQAAHDTVKGLLDTVRDKIPGVIQKFQGLWEIVQKFLGLGGESTGGDPVELEVVEDTPEPVSIDEPDTGSLDLSGPTASSGSYVVVTEDEGEPVVTAAVNEATVALEYSFNYWLERILLELRLLNQWNHVQQQHESLTYTKLEHLLQSAVAGSPQVLIGPVSISGEMDMVQFEARVRKAVGKMF